jgi:hypothetical protein
VTTWVVLSFLEGTDMGRKPGKYAAVTAGLKRLPFGLRGGDEDEGRSSDQLVIEHIKKTITNRAPTALALEWLVLRGKKDVLKGELKEIELHLKAHEQLMEEVYEAQSLMSQAIKIDNVIYNVDYELQPIGFVQNKEEHHHWGMEEYPDLMKMPWNTRERIVKENLLAGRPIPPGIDLYLKPSFKRR